MASRKDYERAAALVRRTDVDVRVAVAAAFLRYFQADGNERFDANRFALACVPRRDEAPQP